MKQEKKHPAAVALHAGRDGAHDTAAQAAINKNCHGPSFVASLVLAFSSVLAASGQAGVNLEPTSPPNYSTPLTLYVRDGHIYGAWAVGNRGNNDAAPFEVGFYGNQQRMLVARFSNGLRAGYRGYGTDAPFDWLPEGTSTLEVRVNDSRLIGEDTFADNTYSLRVTVTRGGGNNGGGNPPAALTRAEAGYKYPSTLGYSSTSRAVSRMTDLFNVQWAPSADFVNWRLSGSTGSYAKGARQYGLPYSQANPQTDVNGFVGHLPAVKGTLNSTSGVGVDCSGSISIALELPSRHTTWSFDQSSSYFTTVVLPGKLVKNAAQIRPGDVLTSSSWGHCVLVIAAPVNGKVQVLESTADQGINANGQPQRWAVVKNTRALSDLDVQSCRAIRRAKLQ